MQKWLYLVESNSKDPSREEDFILWYQTMHLPDMRSCPGIVHARHHRNTNPQPGEGRFLAVYDIESDNIEKTMADRRPIIQKALSSGRNTDLLDVVGRRLFREVPCPP